MKWVADRTGRFVQRPHYDRRELDVECEAILTKFLLERHGKISLPIDTNDLVVLVDQETNDLDLYADLSPEGDDVEGVTLFNPTGKPDVKLARRLVEEPWATNRLRTTLTHELGHVKFHNFLWPTEARPTLFSLEDGQTAVDTSPRCKREAILSAPSTDWMEWQAGYACGAFLMPITSLTKVVKALQAAHDQDGAIVAGTTAGQQLIQRVRDSFQVSADAARVRLSQLELLVETPIQTNRLF